MLYSHHYATDKREMMIRNSIQRTLLAAIVLASPGLFAKDIVDIEIRQFQFIPAEITVSPGTTIRWTNKEKRQYHNVWFEELGEEEPDYLFPEDRYQRTFNDTGSFPYRCGPHPKMRGIVHVQ